MAARRKSLRRKLRRAAVTAAAVIAVLLAAVAALWVFFPENRVAALVEAQSDAAGWPVRIGTLSVHPAGRVEMTGVSAAFRPSPGADSIPFFRVERLALRFRLLPLLRRELSISAVEIENPEVFTGRDFLEGLKAFAASQPPKKASEPKPLPVDLGIKSLALRDFSLKTALPEPSPVREIRFDGLNLDVEGLRVPKDFAGSPSGYGGLIRLFTGKSRLRIDMEPSGLSFRPRVDLAFRWGGKSAWTFGGEAGLKSDDPDSMDVAGLGLSVSGLGFADTVSVESIRLLVCGRNALEVTGGMRLVSGLPEFDLRLLGRVMPLESLKPVLLKYLPPPADSLLRLADFSGTLTLASGTVQGNPEAIRFNIHSALDNAFFMSSMAPVRMEAVRAGVEIRGLASPKGLETADLTGSLGIPLIRLEPAGAPAMDLLETTASWSMSLDRFLMPSKGVLSASVEKILGGAAEAKAEWSLASSGPMLINSLAATAGFRLSSLRLESFPAAAKDVKGSVDAAVDLNVRNAGDIRMALKASLSELSIPFRGKPEPLKPLSAKADMEWHAEKNFRKWVLDRTVLEAAGCLFTDATGEVDGTAGRWAFRVKRAVLENRGLTAFLPAPLLEENEGMELSGREILDLTAGAGFAAAAPGPEISGRLEVESAGVSLPLQGLEIQGLNARVDLSGNAEHLGGKGEAGVASMTAQKFRPEPIRDSALNFSWTFSPPDRFDVSGARWSVPDLALSGGVSIALATLDAVPSIDVSADFVFASQDTVRLMPLLSMLGAADGRVRVETVEGDSPRMRVRGEMTADSMVLFSPPLLEVRNVCGRVPFVFDVDPVSGAIAAADKPRSVPAAAFEAGPEIFRKLFSDLSEMHIDSVMAAGYAVQDISVDLLVADGSVQAPRFRARLLGGSVAGNLSMDLGDGRPENISYFLKADAARINSATLIRSGIPDEDTELNAALEFRGRGLDPKGKLDLDGALHITKIGPRFAGTLLEGIDPQGTNRQIRLTRRLFDMRYKPRLFSFEVRHGYVYPSIALSQPWYSPLRIPGKVEYGRLPLEFFLKNPALQAKP